MEISEIVQKQKEFFDEGKTKDVSYRIKMLKKLRECIKQEESNINEALKKDLNKSEFETYMTETGMVLAELNNAISHVKNWSKIKKVATPLAQFHSKNFDYIFFTGGSRVGQIVMEKASQHLTPVTLELGGKSPCIITKDANIPLAAKRIAFGKLLNAGQTCVAPDYLLVEQEVKEELISYLEKYIKEFLEEKPLENANYPKIINEKHFHRIQGYLENQNIIFGGKGDNQTLKLEELAKVVWEIIMAKMDLIPSPIIKVF